MKVAESASTPHSTPAHAAEAPKTTEKKAAAPVRVAGDSFEPAPARTSTGASGSRTTPTVTRTGSTGTGTTGAAAGRTGATTAAAATPPAGTAPTLDNVVDSLKAGKKDDETRAMIGQYFAPLGMAESNAAMQRIRDEGLMDNFIDATARDKDGNPVTQEAKDALKLVMGSGRLDVYAETLATVPITVADLGSSKEKLYYDPGSKGVFLDQASLSSMGSQDVANVLAHEMFHAFSDAHGGDGYSALDEGFGIAAREYAFSDGNYNLAEMVYGTKSFYRDIRHEPSYQFGDFSNADPKLKELMQAFASRDSSQLAWDKPDQLQAEYDKFFSPINRNQDWNSWLAAVDQATKDMQAARAAGTSPTKPEPKNPIQQIIDWLSSLFGK